MSISVNGLNNVQSSTTNSYFVELYYVNGTSFTEIDTKEALANMTISIYTSSNKLVGSATGKYYSAGQIEFNMSLNPGQYYAFISTCLHDPTYVSASNIIDVNSAQSIQDLVIVPTVMVEFARRASI